MKNSILAIMSLIILGSCSPNTNNNLTPAPQGISTSGTDSTEGCIQGSWYLQSIADSQVVNGTDTGVLYGPYTTSAYTEFKQSASPSVASLNDQYMDCQDAGILSTPTRLDMIGTVSNVWWYYNNANGNLVVMGFQYKILQLTTTALVVQYTAQDNRRRTYTFSK